MTDKQDPKDWMAAWTSAQQEAWRQLLAGMPAEPAPRPAPPPMGDDSQLSRQLLEFGDQYLGLSREFWNLLQVASATRPTSPGAAADPLESLAATFSKNLQQLYGQVLPGGDALAAWAGLGESLVGAPPAWPGMPALGPGRERQAQQARLLKAATRFQQALEKHGQLLSRVSSAAVKRMTERLSREDAVEPGSLREMHELWVDSGEQAFAAAAQGAEFAAAQAELNAALLELRSEQQRLVEDWARALDLPTRAEVNTINERMKDLRRRLREIEEELDRLRGRSSG